MFNYNFLYYSFNGKYLTGTINSSVMYFINYKKNYKKIKRRIRVSLESLIYKRMGINIKATRIPMHSVYLWIPYSCIIKTKQCLNQHAKTLKAYKTKCLDQVNLTKFWFLYISDRKTNVLLSISHIGYLKWFDVAALYWQLFAL